MLSCLGWRPEKEEKSELLKAVIAQTGTVRIFYVAGRFFTLLITGRGSKKRRQEEGMWIQSPPTLPGEQPLAREEGKGFKHQE